MQHVMSSSSIHSSIPTHVHVPASLASCTTPYIPNAQVFVFVHFDLFPWLIHSLRPYLPRSAFLPLTNFFP